MLQCSNCNYRRFSDGTDIQDLVEVKTCQSCGTLSKKFKCPGCGHVIKGKRVQAEDPTDNQRQNLR